MQASNLFSRVWLLTCIVADGEQCLHAGCSQPAPVLALLPSSFRLVLQHHKLSATDHCHPSLHKQLESKGRLP